MEQGYDICESLYGSESKFHANCNGLKAAIALATELAATSTNDFFVTEVETRTVAAKIPRGIV